MNRSSLAAPLTRAICAVRPIRWTLPLLLAAAVGTVSFGASAQNASPSLVRTDSALAAALGGGAIGDLDQQNGKDIELALSASGNGGVLPDNRHGTLAPSSAPPPPTCDDPGSVPMLVGTPGDDVLVGTAGRDVLSGLGGDDCLFGGAGDDRLSGGTGADLLRGADGNDRMNGDAGDDRLIAGNGADTITPGAGSDRVSAGGGNDTVFARDGERDTIDCGAGRDRVFADRMDRISRNCEVVKRPPP